MKRALLSVLLVGLLAGCGDDDGPVRPQPVPQFRYPSPSTPDSAVLIYAYAWERKDSTKIDSIVAPDYTGMSTDPFDPFAPSVLTFTKTDEIRAVARLALSSEVGAVDVELPAPSTWVRHSYSSDPPDWASVDIPYLRVTIHLSDDALLQTAPAMNEFTMKPSAVSGTDTTWVIVRWRETRTSE